MSQENVEVFRRVNAITKTPESEAAAIRTAARLVAPDYRIENVATAVTDETYRGATAGQAWWREISDPFADGARYEVEEVVADGDDFVVGQVALVGTGARSGVPLQLRWFNVMWFRDGKVTCAAGYPTAREALEAVGLAE